MFRTIRVRLVLSYAGIAFLVTLALGAVLLVRLRSYYASMEQDYLFSNARAIGSLAAPMLLKKLPRDVQDAQVSNLAFLSQTRVRILDPQKHVLADLGPWMSRKIGFGVMRENPKMKIAAPGDPASKDRSTSVIIIQNGFGVSNSRPAQDQSIPALSADGSLSVEGQPDVQYFSAAVPVTNGVYGLYLSRSNGDIGERSTQTVQVPIFDSLGFPMGFVELSESPAYGREIVSSVASALALAGGLAILLAIGVGWLTSRRLTAPLLRLTEATRQMSGGDLSVRVLEAERGDEFGMLGKSFNHMAARIEETVQTLRRFLADAAHELQTPLTALRTNLELARSEDNRLPVENYLTQALEQLDRLQRLLTDLLSLSRLESAAGPDDFQPVDLKVLIQQVSEPYAARAEQAGQVFELHLPTSHPQVSGSPEKLRSALTNLLDNALKFTPTGGAVRVRLDETPDSLCVAVSDTGIGIPPAEIDMLYNRFHRARNASAYPGSGLGLAIVRAIAQAHGGSVQAGNNPHGGATFTLRLPHPANPNAN